MSRINPIDARQQVWWHRIRRLGRWPFVFLGGGLATPLVTCLLFGGVVWYYGYPWSTFITNGTLMWLLTAPLYMVCFFWTWHHMERRYDAALGLRCPGCGYTLHASASMRCSECGWQLAPPH